MFELNVLLYHKMVDVEESTEYKVSGSPIIRFRDHRPDAGAWTPVF